MKAAIRYGAYPLVVGAVAITLFTLAGAGFAYWPLFPLITIAGMTTVAILERASPYIPQWNLDHCDTRVDVLHGLGSQILIQVGIAIAFGTRAWMPSGWQTWPTAWPMPFQILLAGLVLDFGLYAMHRISHLNGYLWKLHVLHHSPERLYWLNGGRRHPLSALVLAGPGLTVLWLLGATPIAVGAWLSFMSVHLAFQHANLDYRLGAFRYVLGVAELHRWHHKRDFEDAQVNFGEVWLIWDHLFGTYHDASRMPGAGEVGLRNERLPSRYVDQLAWPFR